MDGSGSEVFNALTSLQEGLADNAKLLDDFERTVRSAPNIDQDKLDQIADMRVECQIQIRDNERYIAEQQLAIHRDADTYRLLNVGRFFTRNKRQIDELLQQINAQRDENSIQGMIIVTAIMLIFTRV